MWNDPKKRKRPCKQEKKPQPLTDEEAGLASGGVSAPDAPSTKPGAGVYVPDTSSFKLVDGGGIEDKKEKQENGGVSVPATPSFNMNGGGI